VNVLNVSLLRPYLLVRRTEAWHSAHTCWARFVLCTGDDGSVCLRMSCSPWQSVQTGESTLPLASAIAWTLVPYSRACFSWHVAQVSGIWRRLIRAPATAALFIA